MTVDEMLASCNGRNYAAVQAKISDAMLRGKKSETFCMIDMNPKEGWAITNQTIERLKEDGFSVTEYLNKFGIWEGTMEVSW